MELGPMTWIDIDDPIVVVPVGSCEQHGPHLPLHTDTIIATALAHDLATRRGDCVVAPAIAISASGEHAGFAGTLSVGTEVTAGIVIELARSADWASGVVFVNGHGGNVTAMERAAEVFERDRRDVLIWWPYLPDGDPHAGHTETSLMLALAPDEVRGERSVAGPIPAMVDLVRYGVQPISETGVLGDPTEATADHGLELFASLTDHLAAAVADWAG
ncbi:mycofactocin biosynthesis peptidyl-dipeptidase MftE [Ilumatobacter sp.]|uniref:mycofactocin biosynthesis peptidyl-dipeptidase MftE n=1 Tax=Ilumatobacter sp. TaxID=1967498 RepID=UPI003AF4B287